MSSHPGSPSSQPSWAGVIGLAVAVVIVALLFVFCIYLPQRSKRADLERAKAALSEHLYRGPNLHAFAAHEIEQVYAFDNTILPYVVRLSRNNYLPVPDYAYYILHDYKRRQVEDALPEIQAYEQAAAGEPQVSLDEFKKLAVYEVRRKYIIYPVTHLRDGRCVVTLTARGARRQIVRVTPQVFETLVPWHAIRDQLPAIEVALRENEPKKATDE